MYNELLSEARKLSLGDLTHQVSNPPKYTKQSRRKKPGSVSAKTAARAEVSFAKGRAELEDFYHRRNKPSAKITPSKTPTNFGASNPSLSKNLKKQAARVKNYKNLNLWGKVRHSVLGGKQKSKAEHALKKADELTAKIKSSSGGTAVRLSAAQSKIRSKAKWMNAHASARKYGIPAAGVAAAAYGTHKYLQHRKNKARQDSHRRMYPQDRYGMQEAILECFLNR